MNVHGNLAMEIYQIHNRSCRVTVDYDAETITIRSYGFDQEYPMSEYENFDGDMKKFAESKLFP